MCTTVLLISPAGDVYKQMKGFPMGGPISGDICQIYAEFWEQKALQSWQNAPPITWKRYVDDTFNDLIEPYRQHRNNQDKTGKINWTYSIEENSKLPFLDCLIIREADNLKIDLYRKPTTNNRYTPFNSAHCFIHRVQIIDCFLHRIDNICDDEFIAPNRLWLQSITQINGIPNDIFEKRVQLYDAKKDNRSQNLVINDIMENPVISTTASKLGIGKI